MGLAAISSLTLGVVWRLQRAKPPAEAATA
jgi:hypothetical protein